jgi:hypothetical protein
VVTVAYKHDMRTQCPWAPAAITRLYIERAAYERAGRPRAISTAANIEAELAEVARRLGRPR